MTLLSSYSVSFLSSLVTRLAHRVNKPCLSLNHVYSFHTFFKHSVPPYCSPMT